MENKNWEGLVSTILVLLGCTLVLGKATGYMDITWWEATAPFWLPIVLVMAPLLVICVIWLFYTMFLLVKFMSLPNEN